MVQKVTSSILVSRPSFEICGYSTVVSIQVFQTWDESSILSTRTMSLRGLFCWFMLLLLTKISLCAIMRVIGWSFVNQ